MYRQCKARLVGMVFALGFALWGGLARADDTLITTAKDAWRQQDRVQLLRLRNAAMSEHHLLAPWVDYWELNNRLSSASADEVEAFFARWPHTYVEDRLRNDWLLELGKRRDWPRLLATYAGFRMDDDKEVRCYVLLAKYFGGQAVLSQIADAWLDQKEPDQGCTLMANTLQDAGVLPQWVVWSKLRFAVLNNRAPQARRYAAMLGPSVPAAVDDILANPLRYISRKASARTPLQAQLSALALARLSDANSPARAAVQLEEPWQAALPAETVAWVWAAIGRSAAMSAQPEATDYFARSRQWLAKARTLSLDKLQTNAAASASGHELWWDDLLVWQARSAVRLAASINGARPGREVQTARWQAVRESIDALPPQGKSDAQSDPTWIYWRARALLALGDTSLTRPSIPPASSAPASAAGNAVFVGVASGAMPGVAAANAGQPTAPTAREYLLSIVSPYQFYGQLAAQLLGGTLSLPTAPPELSAEERAAIRRHPGLLRAMALIGLGLRSEGVREWNYSLSYSKPGGLDERELLAAAQWACEQEVWDRCINTSDRTRYLVNVDQRYPTPYRRDVLRAAQDVGLDPALMYGLIRQESRFIADARSGVGAAGLMQIMPATARWTARKLGLDDAADHLNHAQSNLRLGAGYLRLLLSDFGGSQALAAAAYNAGPNRPRRWREGVPTETAAWIENIPFTETRDYVKKVLSNASVYSAVLQNSTASASRNFSLAPRLGPGVGPLARGETEREPDIP